MRPQRKEISTELKDLDVDRVDGVDKPATGRAFALYKSADAFYETDAAHIVAVLKRLYPNAEETVKRLIEGACDSCIVKCLNKKDETVGYIVRGTDVTTPQSLEKCVTLVEKIIRGEIAKGRKFVMEDGKPNGMGGGAMDSRHPGERLASQNRLPNFPGSMDDADRSSALLDGPHDHTGNPRKTLWERHTAKGPRIDGQRMQASTKKRGAMIDNVRQA